MNKNKKIWISIVMIIILVITFALRTKIENEMIYTIQFICIMGLPTILVLPAKGMKATKLRRAQDLKRFEEVYKSIQEMYNTEIKPLKWKLKYDEFVDLSKQKIKDTLIRGVAPFLEEQNYNIEDIERDFINAGFMKGCYKLIRCDNNLKGILLNGKEFNIYELVIWDKARREEPKTFKSLWVSCDIVNNINAYINIADSIHIVESKENVEKLELDSDKFEKEFNIYTDNKIIAMQVLTSDVMEMLANINEKYGMYYNIVIKEKKLYISFGVGSIFSACFLNKEKIFLDYSILNYIIDVISIVNRAINSVNI